MLQKIKRLHEKLDKASSLQAKYAGQLREIQDACKHEFPKAPFYFGYDDSAPEGMTHHLDAETCLLCGKDCHDPEEWK